jgi:hypothetical protein
MVSLGGLGRLDRIRTYNPQIRSLVLYPVELRGVVEVAMRKKWRERRDSNPRPPA